jgi:hypothetical protein
MCQHDFTDFRYRVSPLLAVLSPLYAMVGECATVFRCELEEKDVIIAYMVYKQLGHAVG